MSSILFVDDDKNVLEGLERNLWKLRKKWNLVFANSGEEAISAMDQDAFDVIVSDMRMPGMDGYQLLEHVRVYHPDTIRMILSGQTEHEAALRAVNVAHQFLAKPCEGRLLREILTRAVDQRQMFQSPDMRRLISEIGSLPITPAVYFELTDALMHQASMQEIAEIVQRDLGITSKLLQIVNSAFFGLPRRFETIHETVAYLGTDMVRSLALSVEVFRPFDETDPVSLSALEGLQRHALACGELSRRIACPENADQAFLAGMMHDVGKLVIAGVRPEVFRELAVESRAGPRSWRELELDKLGVGHGAVGAYLLSSWGLPLDVTDAVAYHHEPGRTEPKGLDALTAVHVADALLYEVDTGSQKPGRTHDGQLDEELIDRLGLVGELDRWREWAKECVEQKLGD